MGSGELVLSDWAATGFLIFLVGVPVVAFVQRRLASQLEPVAVLMLALALSLQILMLLASAAITPAWSHGYWLFDIDAEWNIPSAITSTQLALVGGVALVTAALRYSARSGQWRPLLGLGLVFIFLAVDDYTEVYKGATGTLELLLSWRSGYAALGSATFVAVACAALHAPRGGRRWHQCLAAGIALMGIAGLIIDAFEPPCGIAGLLQIEGCLKTAVLEEFVEYLGVWLALTAVLGYFSQVAPTTSSRAKQALWAIPAIWVGFLVIITPLAPFAPVATYDKAQTAAVAFESGVSLHGFMIQREGPKQGVHLFLSPDGFTFDGLGFSIHMIDEVTEVSVAGSDNYATDQLAYSPRKAYIPVFRQWTELNFAQHAVANRAYWLVATLWREDNGNYVREKILSSDLRLLDDTQIILAEMVFRPAPSLPPALASFSAGLALESVDLPDRVGAGEILHITISWRSETNIQNTYIQFLHFVHEESGDWWGL